MTFEEVLDRMRSHVGDLLGCFEAPMKITIVVRDPEKLDGGLVMTTEANIEDAIAEMRHRESAGIFTRFKEGEVGKAEC